MNSAPDISKDQSQGWSKFTPPQSDSETEDEEHFVYPSEPSNVDNNAPLTSSHQVHPSPAQLESIYAAASSGDLPLLKKLFRTALESGDVESFSLANDASTRTGFTALHAAASRGFHDVAVWRKHLVSCMLHPELISAIVIEECGAMPDLEDKEGEVSKVQVMFYRADSPKLDGFA